MKILFVTSEIAGLYKLGGLADVSYALPVALSAAGVDVAVVMPYYEKVRIDHVVCVGQLAIDFDRRRELVFVFQATLPGTTVPVFLFRHPLLNQYAEHKMAERFAFFSKAVAQLYLYAQEMLGGPYDLIHCNDWHTALVPFFVGEENRVVYRERGTIQSTRSHTILTIHNLLYQGETGAAIALKLGVPRSLLHTFMTPLGRAVRLLQEGLEYADVVTTVSPTYAKEIYRGNYSKKVRQTFIRRADKPIGILNGIDANLWNPARDPHIPVHYGKRTVLNAKAEIKRRLRRSLHLPEAPVPLIGFVGRLESRQKGLDLIAAAVRVLPKDAYQLVVLGTGQKPLVTQFTHLAAKHAHVSFVHTFDERLARRIYAGSDLMLVPSKFEPCGLTQMIAMRYGTLPVVRQTGGLADSVRDGLDGFVFKRYTRSHLVSALEKAINIYKNDTNLWHALIRRAMRKDFSWKTQAAKYIRLYQAVCAQTSAKTVKN